MMRQCAHGSTEQPELINVLHLVMLKFFLLFELYVSWSTQVDPSYTETVP
jgi:hypothetical protein